MTDHLPARQPTATGPTGVPLSQTPTEALAFALGYVVARPVHADQYGGVCALVGEIMPRDPRTGGPTDRAPALVGSPSAMLLRHMPAALAAAVPTVYMRHPGQ